jgi:hypothetical protein
MYDVRVRREERICLYFFESKGDRFLAKGASYLLEGEELLIGCVLNEVDV